MNDVSDNVWLQLGKGQRPPWQATAVTQLRIDFLESRTKLFLKMKLVASSHRPSAIARPSVERL
jgi:hypothetical protein